MNLRCRIAHGLKGFTSYSSLRSCRHGFFKIIPLIFCILLDDVACFFVKLNIVIFFVPLHLVLNHKRNELSQNVCIIHNLYLIIKLYVNQTFTFIFYCTMRN
jgi:hypothetical protein